MTAPQYTFVALCLQDRHPSAKGWGTCATRRNRGAKRSWQAEIRLGWDAIARAESSKQSN